MRDLTLQARAIEAISREDVLDASTQSSETTASRSAKSFLLDFEIFEDGFDDDMAARKFVKRLRDRETFAHPPGAACFDPPFFDQTVDAPAYDFAGVLRVLRVGIVKKDVGAAGCGNLRDALSHGAGAHHSDPQLGVIRTDIRHDSALPLHTS